MSNSEAALAMAKIPDFERSRYYERVYIDRVGRAYRLQTRNTPDAQFSSRSMAAAHMSLHGYRRDPAHDTNARFAYVREPEQPSEFVTGIPYRDPDYDRLTAKDLDAFMGNDR